MTILNRFHSCIGWSGFKVRRSQRPLSHFSSWIDCPPPPHWQQTAPLPANSTSPPPSPSHSPTPPTPPSHFLHAFMLNGSRCPWLLSQMTNSMPKQPHWSNTLPIPSSLTCTFSPSMVRRGLERAGDLHQMLIHHLLPCSLILYSFLFYFCCYISAYTMTWNLF